VQSFNDIDQAGDEIANHPIAVNYRTISHRRRCAMWRMSNVQALIFVAAVVLMVALAAWWLAL
jgi:hypothetical protein